MTTRHDAGVVVDIRDETAYNEGHVRGSFSFPWVFIAQEACGLPPRNCGCLRVVAPAHGEPDDAAVSAFFQRLGFAEIVVVRVGDRVPSSVALTRSPTRGFCWAPNPFLSAHVARVETLCGGPGCALDVGSGSGRDLVFLACRGWTVVGVENRHKLVVQANQLAAKHGVAGRVCNIHADVAANDNRGVCLRSGCVDLLSVCRFIHRPSLPHLLRLVRIGGVVLYSHFLEGCERTSVGRPKNASGFFLRGELETLLVEGGLSIEHCEELTLPDGRPTINAIAVKRAPCQ